MNTLIVYESKYGNTRLVAETIAKGIMETGEAETTLVDVGQVDLSKATEYDLILIGSPNHMGGPTRGVSKFIDELAKLDLNGRWVAVFDTILEETLRRP